MKKYIKLTLTRNHIIDTAIITFSLCFSIWLMFSTFSHQGGDILVATKAWSDFGSHLPLIRSFSLGNNFPPEYPLFPGEPIRYHYLFYLAVGLLEKAGLRIDWALNSLSAIGFTALLLMIYAFALRLFKSRLIGVLSVLFFLFNGSFSFLYFLSTHTFLPTLIPDIINNTTFPSFGPYDGKLVSAFWNLNIYTNQRHLALALALGLGAIFLLITPLFKKHATRGYLFGIILGIALGLSFYFHLAILLATLVVILVLSILFKQIRVAGLTAIFLAGALCLPQYLLLQSSSNEDQLGIQFRPGYLSQTTADFSLKAFFEYWIANLGLHVLLIPIALFLTRNKNRLVFLAFFSLFILGNLFQFSSEIAANHKFFNYFMAMGVVFSAYTIFYLWKQNVLGKILAPILIILTMLSGIIDFFPIYNDTNIPIADYPKNKDINWIMKNTPPDAVFLNASYFSTPASLSGRKIFLGWPYFAWSAGHDTDTRGKQVESFFLLTDTKKVCSFLSEHNLEYIIFDERSNDFSYTEPYWNSYEPAYHNALTGITIYDAKTICHQ